MLKLALFVGEPLAQIQPTQVRELMNLLGKIGQAEHSEIEESGLLPGFVGDQPPGDRETFGIGHSAFSA